jgi:hypothetical protein
MCIRNAISTLSVLNSENKNKNQENKNIIEQMNVFIRLAKGNNEMNSLIQSILKTITFNNNDTLFVDNECLNTITRKIGNKYYSIQLYETCWLTNNSEEIWEIMIQEKTNHSTSHEFNQSVYQSIYRSYIHSPFPLGTEEDVLQWCTKLCEEVTLPKDVDDGMEEKKNGERKQMEPTLPAWVTNVIPSEKCTNNV